MKYSFYLSAMIITFAATTLVEALDEKANPATTAGGKDHILLDARDISWRDAPASLPKGTMMAMMEGDFAKEGPFTVRLRFPAGSRIAPHYHPGVEHVTVISGNFMMGLGEKWDDKLLHTMGPGSFMVMNAGTRHFAMSKETAEVQLHGMGPWKIVYVNPEDDPMRKVTTR